MNSASDEMSYTAHELKRETGWVGAFVIGLAGTILVTGIAPVMVTTLGAACIPVTVIITLTGWLLCLFLAELAAMMPERTGGAPSYAYPAFKDRWPRFAKHINGVTAWMYWLGWFPVGPLNMILASFYIAALVRPQHHGRHQPAGNPHCLLDAGYLRRRHAAVFHPGLSRHSFRCRFCKNPRLPLHGAAHLHRRRLDILPLRGPS